MTTAVRVLRIPFTARAWRDLLYAVLALPLGTLGLALVLITAVMSLGSVGAITLLLLPLVMSLVRRMANLHRRLARRLLHRRISRPVRPPRRPGVLGLLAHHLADPGTWKAIGYLFLKLPVSVLQTYLGAGLWFYSLLMIAYPAIVGIPALRSATGNDGTHYGLNVGHYYFDTWPREWLMCGIGVLLLFGVTYYIRGLNMLDGWLMARLLGPGSSVRIRELEETRANAINEAALTVRRIERDLHDGVQAQLVALGIQLGRAERRLDAQDPAAATALLRSSQKDTKDIIKQLRELVRGIHPPALDSGLGPALHTLAARSSVPATARVELPQRPAASVETMLYFSAAELLANTGKHSGASAVSITVLSDGESIRLIVTDDGKGGAALDREVRDRDEDLGRDGADSGSGLRGLAERVRTVDGTMDISSPPGGPTTITIEVPVKP